VLSFGLCIGKQELKRMKRFVFLIKLFPQMNHKEINAKDNISTVKQFVLLEFSDIPNL
jgi:hypothetical protein